MKGFTEGFDLGYRGPMERKDNAANIPLRNMGTPSDLWDKLMKEVKLNRYAGPFDSIPYHFYIQSPIGLVPKAGNQTRLIFHLSYDFGIENYSKSVNHFTPREWCTVKYNDLDYAIQTCLELGRRSSDFANTGNKYYAEEQEQIRNQIAREIYSTIYYSKSDLKSAFRIVPMKPGQRCWLLMMAKNPNNGQVAFFADKCLPFGGSISCSTFQIFSDSLKHVIEHVTGRYFTVTNYLDDFLFIALDEQKCNQMVRKFIELCNLIGCPLSLDKTEWAATNMIFLGLLLNGRTYSLSIPFDKKERARQMINFAMDKKKVTIRFIQRLTGTLNFLNRAIVPGRTFTRCMYDKIKTKGNNGLPLKQYHHVNLGVDVLRDCAIWKTFLDGVDSMPMQMCRPFMDLSTTCSSIELDFYTDASLNRKLGYGGVFDKKFWIIGKWGEKFVVDEKPSIEFLELYALVAAVLTWGKHDKLTNTRVEIFCDNQAVQHMVNNLTSKCPNCMKLIRLLTIDNMKNNRRIGVKYVKSSENVLADALSRFEFKRFWKHAPRTMNEQPDSVNRAVWPVSKVWFGETDSLLNETYLGKHL